MCDWKSARNLKGKKMCPWVCKEEGILSENWYLFNEKSLKEKIVNFEHWKEIKNRKIVKKTFFAHDEIVGQQKVTRIFKICKIATNCYCYWKKKKFENWTEKIIGFGEIWLFCKFNFISIQSKLVFYRDKARLVRRCDKLRFGEKQTL